MKLLTSSHSSYSSPSSSSTLSFDPSLCNAKSATTAGCLTAVLCRILCSGGLPTRPSDRTRQFGSMVSGKDQELAAKHKKTEATTTSTSASATTFSPPGVVAKLMGLESNVEIPFAATQSSSLSHSQSMNSVDYLGECKPMKGLHRRVKSSSLFHEVPTFHLQENENFLVLSFESGYESKGLKSKGRQKESGSLELKKNKREKVHEEKGNLSKRVCDMSSTNVGNDGELQGITNTLPLNMFSSEKEYIDSEAVKFSKPVMPKEVTNGEKLKKGKKRTTRYTEKKVETECSSEDSSPVSVFDFERKALEPELESFGVGLNWRRKLSPELENEQHVLHSDSNLVEEGKVNAIENNKHERSKKKEQQSQGYVDIWGEICRLVEVDLFGPNQMEAAAMRKQGDFNSISAAMRKQVDFDSISAEFESQIFDHLLNELIDQLVSKAKALEFVN